MERRRSICCWYLSLPNFDVDIDCMVWSSLIVSCGDIGSICVRWCKLVPPSDIVEIDPKFRDKIDNIKLKCINFEQGCKVICPTKFFDLHMKNYCEYSEICCYICNKSFDNITDSPFYFYLY